MSEQHIFSVLELNQLLKGLIESVPELNHILIRGELSNYKIYPSGHHYFTLKDADSTLRCVVYRNNAMKLRFRPTNGMKVIVAGRIGVFPRDGAYQLYCDSLSPDGIGDLYLAFEQLKEKLNNEGLFDAGHKKELPRYPQRIAVVTSSAGAAVHDIIRILKKRYPIAKVILLPVRVQGVEAPPEIVGAIRYANRWKIADVMIVGRGGGSLEDLWAFNDERVAHAIYESDIPVISAVGHEPDVAISDFVADRRAATPSNAAEIAVPDMTALLQQIRNLDDRLCTAAVNGMEQKKLRLKHLSQSRMLTDPTHYIEEKQMQLDCVQQNLLGIMKDRLEVEHRKFAGLSASLDALSPLKVLGRGYAMAVDDRGNILHDSAQVQKGDRIEVQLGRGTLGCTVEDRR